MIRRQSTSAPKKASAKTTGEKKLAQARHLWLDLAARLEKARKHGSTLEDVVRRLADYDKKAASVRRR